MANEKNPLSALSDIRLKGRSQQKRQGKPEKNPLRYLSKLQLLELLAQQERELQKLRAELAEKSAALEERKLRMEKAGSIAEAALQLSGIFEAAQQAADLYLESLKAESPEKEDEPNG